MDLRESRIVDAIEQLSNDEAIGLAKALVESPHFRGVPRFRTFLLTELKALIERDEQTTDGAPNGPDLANMELAILSQWVLGAAFLNHVKVAGGIERLADAIVETVAAQV